MNTKTKVIVAGIAALALSLLLSLALEKIATSEARYRAMVKAYPIACEVAGDHPAHRLWEEHKAALLEAGYIETRELPMRHSLAAKGAVPGFFTAFHSRFPGVECSVRDAKSDAPLIVVTARKSDFGPLGGIERFVSRYEAKP